MVAGAPARPAGRHRLALQRRVGVRRIAALLADPQAPVTAEDVEDFVARHPFWTGDWAAFAGRGALADQVRFEREWTALRDVRARARRAHLRRRADLRRRRQRRARCASRALPCGRGRRRAARLAVQARPALGQSALRVAHASRDALPLVDRAPAPHLRARRHGAHRPFPRLRRVLGDPGRAQDREAGPLARRTGRRAVPRGGGGARRAAARRRGSRSDHAAGRATAEGARLPGDGRPAVGVRRRSQQSARARRTTRSSRSSTRRRTTPTRRAAGSSRCRGGNARHGARPARAAWSLIESRTRRARPSRSSPRRTCSGSAARTG